MPYQRIDSLTETQVIDLHELYQKEWWTKGRSLDDVRIMVENSTLITGFTDGDGKLIAFCRILTDFVFRAVVYDVIVAERLRGQGLGRQLMTCVTDHPRLRRVSTIWLCCNPEMVPFYEQWGFVVFEEGQLWMLKAQREG